MALLSAVVLSIPIFLAQENAPTDGIGSTLLILVVIVAALVGIGAAAWYFMRRRTPATPEAVGDVTEPVRPAAPAKKSSWTSGKTTSAGMIALLEILEGPEGRVDGMSAGRKIEIYSGRVRIGRSHELCDLQLYDIDDNSTVSRRHCTIEFDRPLNSFVIIDEGSRSGTRVGNTMIEPHQRFPLKEGDIIELGFVEQSGARLRFTSPIARANRAQETAAASETPPAAPTPEAAPVVIPPDAHPERDEPAKRDEMVGVDTEVRHQHAPLSGLASKAGAGPLAHPQEPCDVFLSYSRKDRETMMRVRTDLRANTVSVWTDENLTPGTPLWRQTIENAIENAGCIVVILSPDAKTSPWVQRELDYASTQDKPIIPLLVRGDERTAIPLTLISAQWADLRENYEVQFTSVLSIIKKTIEQAKSG